MRTLNVHPEVTKTIEEFSLPQSDEGLTFGQVLAPIMIECDYRDGAWAKPVLKPYSPLTLDPTSKIFHYGQCVYEGMKAYRVDGAGPYLFRPLDNLKRINQSAKRMAMPQIDEQLWMDSIIGLVRHCHDFIPQGSGESLYIRPFVVATEEHLGIKPSTQFKFVIVASPSGAYFTGGSISVLVEREYVRACPGGTGSAKTGGNYSGALASSVKAQQHGLNQTLWLDAIHRRYVEELSGMNFFSVIDGSLVTPETSDTILPGITRESLLKLAKDDGINIEERPIDIDELKAAIKDGRCTETFACGTAVILTPISEVAEEDGEKLTLKESYGPVAKSLRQKMLDLQEGRSHDPYGWRFEVPM
ncbi:MAG: branched-chain amino acid aminotransferase [Bacteriovoracaceae bacterium]